MNGLVLGVSLVGGNAVCSPVLLLLVDEACCILLLLLLLDLRDGFSFLACIPVIAILGVSFMFPGSSFRCVG